MKTPFMINGDYVFSLSLIKGAYHVNTYFGGVSRFYYTEIDAAKAHRWKTSKSALPGTIDKKEMNREIPGSVSVAGDYSQIISLIP